MLALRIEFSRSRFITIRRTTGVTPIGVERGVCSLDASAATTRKPCQHGDSRRRGGDSSSMCAQTIEGPCGEAATGFAERAITELALATGLACLRGEQAAQFGLNTSAHHGEHHRQQAGIRGGLRPLRTLFASEPQEETSGKAKTLLLSTSEQPKIGGQPRPTFRSARWPSFTSAPTVRSHQEVQPTLFPSNKLTRVIRAPGSP